MRAGRSARCRATRTSGKVWRRRALADAANAAQRRRRREAQATKRCRYCRRTKRSITSRTCAASARELKHGSRSQLRRRPGCACASSPEQTHLRVHSLAVDSYPAPVSALECGSTYARGRSCRVAQSPARAGRRDWDLRASEQLQGVLHAPVSKELREGQHNVSNALDAPDRQQHCQVSLIRPRARTFRDRQCWRPLFSQNVLRDQRAP